MEEKSLISSLVWIPKGFFYFNCKGFAKKVPLEYDLDEEEVLDLKGDAMIKEFEKENLEDLEEDEAIPVFTSELSNLKKGDENYPDAIEEMSDEEKEDFTIKKTDSLIAAAKIVDDFSTVEIYIYEELNYNLYVHHEITLSAFPLCLEWLSVNPEGGSENLTKGNFLIVGTFLPEIEIWDLDVINAIQPKVVLGGQEDVAPGKKKKGPKKFKEKKILKENSHSDAVMCLNVNHFRKNILASGSADMTVKLWDLSNKKCLNTYNIHKEKVQVAKWNPQEEPILLTSGFDKKINILDVRQSNTSLDVAIPADIESACWDLSSPYDIYFCLENGCIGQIDVRKLSQDYSAYFQAHQKSVTSINSSPFYNGVIGTTSEDGVIKIWDTKLKDKNGFKLICSKNTEAGKLYSGNFCPDSKNLFACGSSAGEVVLWDLKEEKSLGNYKAEEKIPEKFESNISKKTIMDTE